jgi:Tol biopolymer transport system component
LTKTVATSTQEFINFFSTLDRKKTAQIGVEEGWDIKNLSFSNDGRLLLVANSKQIFLYDGMGKTLIKTMAVPEGQKLKDVAFSPDGKQIAMVANKDLAQCCDR